MTKGVLGVDIQNQHSVNVVVDLPSSSSTMLSAEDTAISYINQTIIEANELHVAVEQLSGADKTSKQYRYLEEMLTRLLLRLDGVDAAGSDRIRMMRKDAIVSIQAVLDQLELKVIAAQQSNAYSVGSSLQLRSCRIVTTACDYDIYGFIECYKVVYNGIIGDADKCLWDCVA